MDTVFSGFIGRSRNDTSFRGIARTADDYRFTDQFRMTLLLDRGEEGVHVHMQYPPHTSSIVLRIITRDKAVFHFGQRVS